MDYLDYINEWTWYQREQVNQLTSAVVYMHSKKGQRIECGNHTHILTTRKLSPNISGEQIYADVPTSTLHNECWYKTVHTSVKGVLSGLSRENIRLAEPLERALTMIATWRMVHAGTTPTLLPYDTFKTVWWDATENGTTAKVSKDMLDRMPWHDVKRITQMKIEQVPKPKEAERRVIFWFPEGEHGLHALQNAMGPDIFRQILSFTNARRRDRGNPERITLKKLNIERRKCEHCHEPPYLDTSVLGVYYAPPGAGKTTAQNREYLIAYDTDWIGKGITWREVSPLLRWKIPILTNQCEGFVGSGLKVVGVYNHHLRTTPDGKPYVTFEAVDSMQRVQRVNFNFTRIPETQYFSDNVLPMQIKHVLHQMIAEYAMDRLPHYQQSHTEGWAEKWNKLMKGDVVRTQHYQPVTPTRHEGGGRQ